MTQLRPSQPNKYIYILSTTTVNPWMKIKWNSLIADEESFSSSDRSSQTQHSLKSKACWCYLVIHSCLTLCDFMNCSMPGFPVPHHSWSLLEFRSIGSVMTSIHPSHPLIPSSPSAFNLSQHQELFQRINCLHQMTKILAFQLQHQSFLIKLKLNSLHFSEGWERWGSCRRKAWNYQRLVHEV